MAWIESHQELARHRKTKRLARKLEISVPAAIGHLHIFWWWAMDYAQDGNLSKFDPDDIADGALWEGKSDFLEAMHFAEFVDFTDGIYLIHDWYEYCGRLIERRAADALRKKNSRKKTDVLSMSSGHPTDGAQTAHVTEPNLTVPNQTKPNHSFVDDTDSVIVYNIDFEDFWNSYPRQVEKIPAFKTWQRLIDQNVNPDLLVACAMNYSDYCKMHVSSDQFIKYPSSFLDKDKYKEYANPVVEIVNTAHETVYKLYRRKLGMITADSIDLYVKHFGEETVKHAIEYCHDTNRRERQDMVDILKVWENSGVREPWKLEGRDIFATR